MIEDLQQEELEIVNGGWVPLLILAGKAFMAGAGIAAVYLAAEDLSGADGHNHYGK